MSSLTIDADIKVTRPEGHSAYSPGTSEELTIIAMDLLVKDIGYEGAQKFIGQVLERHKEKAALIQADQASTE
ncbi:hypothetical protein [Pseudomonas akapageensis]|uniref:hypothetical protein n=1 Tax=Pseudomonas akapageensis TaxID=2609961 RepID=UPI0014074BDB|nr:hypothetical protein [Pseudomonas akapageensis]